MYNLEKKNSYRRQISDNNMRYAPYHEVYYKAAEHLGVEHPIPLHILHVKEVQIDGSIEYPPIARVAVCPDGKVRTQMTTAAIELFSKIPKGVLAVFIHELSHHKHKDMNTILLAKWVPFIFNIILSVFILSKVGVLDVVFSTDGFGFAHITQASENQRNAEDVRFASSAVERIKAEGGTPPARLIERMEAKPEKIGAFTIFFRVLKNGIIGYSFVIIVAVRLYFVMFFPLLISHSIANAVMLGVARPQEFKADVEAARIVGTEAYIKVLEELNDGSLASKLTQFFHDTHPPIASRIEHLEMLREAGILTKNGLV